MAVIQDLFDSLFGNLEGQASEQDKAAEDYLKQLQAQSGREYLQEGLTAEPIEGRSAQLEALRRMQDISNQGGLTAIDRARLSDINRQANQQEQSQRQAILQGAAQRGTLGGGASLAAQMQAQQASADRRAQGGLSTAAMAQQRALEALQQSGGMASNMRGQDQSRAAAQDAINRFNAGQRADANRTSLNTGMQQYLSQQQKAQNLRDRQRRGENALGGLVSGAAGLVAPIKLSF